MRILAIETSTMVGGVAIMGETEGLIAEQRLNVRTAHSERLMSAVAQALKQAGLQISDIDVFGLSTGPGSFTGLRIGLSAIKGFSFATGKPVVSVPTLEALAWNFPFSAFPVCTMLDARKKEVYAAVFRWVGGGFERVIEEAPVKPLDLLETLEYPVIFTGEGSLIYRDVVQEIAGKDAIFAPPQYMVPLPSNVAYLCLKKAANGEFSASPDLVPFYIRKSEAELKLKQ